MITLMQTGKSRPRPIVLMEPKGSAYWDAWMHFVKSQLVAKGFISQEDLKLVHIARSVDAAVRYIEDFYRVYHSIRYVSGLAVIRLNRMVSQKTLKYINSKFKDILSEGDIRAVPPTDKEIKENEFLDLPRLALHFNMRDYGRLCEMIRAINRD